MPPMCRPRAFLAPLGRRSERSRRAARWSGLRTRGRERGRSDEEALKVVELQSTPACSRKRRGGALTAAGRRDACFPATSCKHARPLRGRARALGEVYSCPLRRPSLRLARLPSRIVNSRGQACRSGCGRDCGGSSAGAASAIRTARTAVVANPWPAWSGRGDTAPPFSTIAGAMRNWSGAV